MDEIDLKIIAILQKNAREPFLQIAKKLNVSEGTIRKRVSKLLKKGIIENFTLNLKGQTSAVIEVITDPRITTEKISDEIKKLDVSKVLETAGRVSIICFAKTDSLQETNSLVEKIRSIEGVLQTETLPVLKEI